MKVTALAGGVGGAKLLVGLQRVLGKDLTAIVNTGDDTLAYGYRVSPDVDIVTYWLAGIADRRRGWGIRGDTFAMVEMRRRLGDDGWFSLGDRDAAVCGFRTSLIDQGHTLSDVTDLVRLRLGVAARILPMSDDDVQTFVTTTDGRVLEFQEYFVRERCEPDVSEITFEGIGSARPAPGVLDALADADRIIICPSNPFLSIEPILAVAGIRDAVAAHDAVTAISPIVAGTALKGPADRLMARLGHDVSAVGVARLYADVCDTFVIDEVDRSLAGKVEAAGMSALVANTVMKNDDVAEELAHRVTS